MEFFKPNPIPGEAVPAAENSDEDILNSIQVRKEERIVTSIRNQEVNELSFSQNKFLSESDYIPSTELFKCRRTLGLHKADPMDVPLKVRTIMSQFKGRLDLD